MSYDPERYKFNSLKKLFLSDKKTQQEYDALEEEFTLLAEMLRARKRAKKTQKDIAKKMHTAPSAVSRLESLENWESHSPTLATLKKYAKAVGCRISIKLVPENAH